MLTANFHLLHPSANLNMNQQNNLYQLFWVYVNRGVSHTVKEQEVKTHVIMNPRLLDILLQIKCYLIAKCILNWTESKKICSNV